MSTHSTRSDPHAWIAELPAPEDDGAAEHLLGLRIPSLALLDVEGTAHDLKQLSRRLVMFVYPATGVPGRDPQLDPAPGWDDVPGAPGCTVHSLGYRDLIAGFQSLGFTVVGVSAQPSDEQREFVARNNIPFVVLSDPQFALAAALGLPTFTVGARRFYRRLSAVVVDGTIEHVSYPVFPPHTNAAEVLKWLRSMTADGDRL